MSVTPDEQSTVAAARTCPMFSASAIVQAPSAAGWHGWLDSGSSAGDVDAASATFSSPTEVSQRRELMSRLTGSGCCTTIVVVDVMARPAAAGMAARQSTSDHLLQPIACLSRTVNHVLRPQLSETQAPTLVHVFGSGGGRRCCARSIGHEQLPHQFDSPTEVESQDGLTSTITGRGLRIHRLHRKHVNVDSASCGGSTPSAGYPTSPRVCNRALHACMRSDIFLSSAS